MEIFIFFNPLWTKFFFSSFFGTLPKIGSFRLPTHRRDRRSYEFFLMIPSLNGIEISMKGATSVLLGVNGLILDSIWYIFSKSLAIFFSTKLFIMCSSPVFFKKIWYRYLLCINIFIRTYKYIELRDFVNSVAKCSIQLLPLEFLSFKVIFKKVCFLCYLFFDVESESEVRFIRSALVFE